MCFLNMITDNRLIEINFKMFYFGSDTVCSLVILPDCNLANVLSYIQSLRLNTSWFPGKCVDYFFCIISLFLNNRVIVRIQI